MGIVGHFFHVFMDLKRIYIESLSLEEAKDIISFRQKGRKTFWSEAKASRGEIEHPNTIYSSSVGRAADFDGLCFFLLDCLFWRPKIGNPRLLPHWPAFFISWFSQFRLVSFFMQSSPRVRKKIDGFFFTDKLMVSHRRFPPNRPFVKIPTDHWCFIAQFSPTPDPWCLGFIMGTRSKTTRSFR